MTSHAYTEGRRSSPAGLAWALRISAVLLWMFVRFAAADPATQPTVSDQQLTQWVTDLDSRAPAVRATATAAMMSLRRDDLDPLKAVVQKAQPLSAAQVQVLHDVVTQVFLSGEPYKQNESGFLGMGMYQADLDDSPANADRIMVKSRIIGFGAYQSLLEGDVILSISERPDVPLRGTAGFIEVVSHCKPGTVLHLVLLRQGHQITVAVTVNARPSDIPMAGDPDVIEELIAQFSETRRKAAETYWQKQFGPAISETLSVAN